MSVGHFRTIGVLKINSEAQYITEYDRPHYEARDLYDRRAFLKKNNYAVRRFLKNIEGEYFDGKVDLENKAIKLMQNNTVQMELIRFTKSIDGTSDKTDTIFTGDKAVWYDAPLKSLIKNYYNGDINDFYYTVENMGNDEEVDTGLGKIPKNLALQFIQALRLIVSQGVGSERYNRGVFRIHHDLQIAPPYVVDILGELGYHCESTCVMEKSELEFERGNAPQWIINMADKPYKKGIKEEVLTEEEKRVFAKVGKTEMIVMEGGCSCGHTKTDHYKNEMCVDRSCQACKCSTFKLRNNTKRTIEV